MSVATIEKRGRKESQSTGDTPERRYRNMVIAAGSGTGPAEPDPTILEAAVRLLGDFVADVKNYRRRVQAVGELREVVPELQRQAAEAEAKLRAVQAVGDKSLAGFATIRDLADALTAHFQQTSAGYVSQERAAAAHARGMVASSRASAVQALNVSADPSIEREIGELRREINGLQAAIAARRDLANLEAKILEQTQLCSELADGRGLSQFQRRNDFRKADVLYAETKAELRRLIGLRPKAAEARAQDSVDRTMIGEVEQRMVDLEQQKLDPARMVWSA